MVNKTCHQFIDELSNNINPVDVYISYYKNILHAKNVIENIYRQNGRQFWPTRTPRNDGVIIHTESVINLYKMFEGIMSSLDNVFNISNVDTLNKIKQVLNEIINKFDDGTLLMTRSQATGSMERSADEFIFDFEPVTEPEVEELFNLVSNTNMPTNTYGTNNTNNTINTNYKETTDKITQFKQTKREKNTRTERRQVDICGTWLMTGTTLKLEMRVRQKEGEGRIKE